MTKHLDLLKKKQEELRKAIESEQNRKIKLESEPREGNLCFFEFRQTNSGGHWEINDKLCKRLFIEAHNYEEARDKALNMGVYFNGCDNGLDCSCCGDRWYDCEDKLEFPYRFGTLSLQSAKDSGYKYEKTTFVYARRDKPDPNEYDLIFDTIKEYAQYLADDYSWYKQNEIKARLFYYDGRVVEIKKKDRKKSQPKQEEVTDKTARLKMKTFKISYVD